MSNKLTTISLPDEIGVGISEWGEHDVSSMIEC